MLGWLERKVTGYTRIDDPSRRLREWGGDDMRETYDEGECPTCGQGLPDDHGMCVRCACGTYQVVYGTARYYWMGGTTSELMGQRRLDRACEEQGVSLEGVARSYHEIMGAHLASRPSQGKVPSRILLPILIAAFLLGMVNAGWI